ncbi:hypothetical protein EVAR_54154_1 [Eumeta japonica]|uniref:Uncharacterized protein n=1 Tax=Eumeta variegata TaxID=151549 RepID=A0A4C1Y468_EUMVA|nr:hypothetical protein EVAR_54154_1 [Eumeta japonica]
MNTAVPDERNWLAFDVPPSAGGQSAAEFTVVALFGFGPTTVLLAGGRSITPHLHEALDIERSVGVTITTVLHRYVLHCSQYSVKDHKLSIEESIEKRRRKSMSTLTRGVCAHDVVRASKRREFHGEVTRVIAAARVRRPPRRLRAGAPRRGVEMIIAPLSSRLR